VGTFVDDRPLLAVVYSPRSRPWSEIAESAEKVCRLLWIADKSELGTTARVLCKLGKVIDTAGRTEEDLIAAVRAEHPDGIVSYFDDDLPLQALLTTALGLPGPSVDAVMRLNDKLLQRRALNAAGIPVPRFTEINDNIDDVEIDRLCETLSFPTLLKPRDGTASRDIVAIADREDLVTALKDAERPSRMILEERLVDTSGSDWCADVVCVETIVSRGVVSHLGVLGFFSIEQPLRLSGLFYPANIPQPEIPDLFGLATAAIHAVSGESTGYFRTEIKRTPDGWKIIEINGRPSGSTPALVQLASGIPVLQLGMRHALGEHVVVGDSASSDRISYRYISEPPTTARRISMISGLNELRERDGVHAIDVLKEVGDPVDWRNGSLDRVFHVTGTAADYVELAEHYRACSTNCFVTYEHERSDCPTP